MTNPNHASVIIPSFNRAQVLSLSLVALQRQSYSKNNYEIIIVDDGSTDQTSDMVRSLAAHNIRLIRTENKGPASARNEGVRHAKGNILIFLDSDFITRRSFLANHLEAHTDQENLLISGMGHWHYIATFDFKEKIYFPELGPFIDRLSVQSALYGQRAPGALITEEEVKAELLERFLFRPEWLDRWGFETIIRDYGESLSDFQMPWLASCTGNMSISRQSFDECGGFDENLRCYEDWEFGVRFIKAGGKIRFKKSVEAYQQFCPPNPERKELGRIYYPNFLAKHPDLDVGLLSILNKFGFSFRALSDIIAQQKTIVGEELKDHLKTLVFNYALELPNQADISFSQHNDKLLQDVEMMDETRFGTWKKLFLQLAERE